MYTIYQVTNRLNGHRYIGFTSRPMAIRWKGHLQTARTSRTKLGAAIRRFGSEVFDITMLEQGDDHALGLHVRERFFIESLKPEYNIRNGGAGKQQRATYKQLCQYEGFWDAHPDLYQSYVLRGVCEKEYIAARRAWQCRKIPTKSASYPPTL